MHRFYVPNISAVSGSVELNKEETRHLRDVLRLKTGSKISIFDGKGNEFECEISEMGKKNTTAKILRQTDPSSPESKLSITLAVGLLKGDKYDLVIQKAVELGTARFIPMHTHRSEMKLSEAEKRIDRWRKIAVEAAKQCGRATVMTIEEPVEFSKLVDSNFTGRKIMFAEEGGEKFSQIEPSDEMAVLIGPKGGWEPAEIELAKGAGFVAVTLGGRILRVETAAIAVCSILQHRFGDMN
jgi:16S rRNA (uracil1498-N3)-methyltransferase